MNSSKTLTRLGLAVSLAIGTAAIAHADVTPNGSFSGAFSAGDDGNVTTTATCGDPGGSCWALGTTTTSVTEVFSDTGVNELTGKADPYLSSPNNLRFINGGLISVPVDFTLSSTTFNVATGTLGTPLTLSVSDHGGEYDFIFTSEKVITKQNGAIDLAFIGNFTSQTGPGNTFTLPASADFSVTFTESAPTGSIGVAYSLDTPPNPAIINSPEPASMAILGAGMLGLSIVRRRRKS